MIRASALIRRAVIDMDAAERLGSIKEIIVDRGGHHVAGFVITRGESIFGGGTQRLIPASALHVIGPDAVTLRGSAIGGNTDELTALPRISDIIGRKMVTQTGRLLGAIGDVLIAREDGRIVGFSIAEDTVRKIENLLGSRKAQPASYVRADSDLQVGNDLIVVPDDAVVKSESEEPEAQTESSPQSGEMSSKWGAASSQPARPVEWTRRGSSNRSKSEMPPVAKAPPPDPKEPIIIPPREEERRSREGL